MERYFARRSVADIGGAVSGRLRKRRGSVTDSITDGCSFAMLVRPPVTADLQTVSQSATKQERGRNEPDFQISIIH